jgi:hypothetical protein
MNGELTALIRAAASVAIAVGVIVAAWQLKMTKKQAITTFEDRIGREYRDLAALIPTKALLGEPLKDEEYTAAFDKLYRYIDLTNEQVFLRQIGRISRRTWNFWKEGIRSNFSRPAF